MASEGAPRPSARGLAYFLFVRPTLAILLIAGLIGGGFVAFGSLVKESSPDLEIPKANVVVRWRGADPATMENQVTVELEKQLKGLEGLKYLDSASFDSYCQVSVEFDAGVDLGEAMANLRAKVDEAAAEFPDDVDKPTVNEVSTVDRPVVSVALYGDIDEGARSRAARELERRLEQVRGVNEVNLSGYREQVVRVRLLMSRLAELGLDPTEVQRRLSSFSVDQPWDRYESPEGGAVVVLYGRFRDIDSLRALPITRVGQGRVVRLSEIAEVEMGLERELSRAELSWEGAAFAPAIDVSVTRLPGADTIAVVDEVRGAIEEFAASGAWPAGLDYAITTDGSIDIVDELNSVFTNAWQATVAVFLVLLVALSWREALIAGLAIPVTFGGALLFVWLLGFTLNNMVIVGMILALGLLVDVFILMMEGMHEGIYGRKESFATAAMATIRAYAAPAFAGQLTTILALAPLMAIGGITGEFIRLIPTAAIVCLLLSFVVALFVCVPISQFLLRRKADAPPSRIDQLSERASGWLEDKLRRFVVVSKVRAGVLVAASIGLLLVALAGATTLPADLFPSDDGRDLGITIELAPDAVLDDSQACADAVGEELRGLPHFESVTKFVGRKSPMALSGIMPSEDRYFVGFSARFVPLEARDRYAFELLDEVRATLDAGRSACPGATVLLSLDTGGASADDPVAIEIIGDDMDALRAVRDEVAAALAQIPGAVDVRDNLGPARLTAHVQPDREALDFYGLTVDDLARQVRVQMAEDPVITFPVGGTEEDIDVVVGRAWPSRVGKPGGPTNRWELESLQIHTPQGLQLPIGAVADPDFVQAPIAITHRDGRRTITVSSRVQDGVTASEVFAAMTPILDEMQADWPPGTRYRFGGEADSTAETFGDAGKMLVLAIFLVFAVLAIQFDSFSQPFIMMVAVPMGLIGTLAFFVAAQLPISFPMLIGVISLTGIVVNDSIVMISTMNEVRDEGASVAEAAAVGAARRLRPILSTTATTLAGMVPLALSAPLWYPLASAIIWGLLAASVFAMITTPALYLLLSAEQRPEPED